MTSFMLVPVFSILLGFAMAQVNDKNLETEARVFWIGTGIVAFIGIVTVIAKGT